MNSVLVLRTSHAGAMLVVILLTCVFILILLVRSLLETRVAAARIEAGQEELSRMNETVCMIQNRIGISHRKLETLSALRCVTVEQPPATDEDDDFRERLTK